MRKVSAKLPALSVWNAEILRLTAFHVLGPQTTDNNWWEEFTKSVPASKTMKPRDGGYEVSGPYGGATLTLKADHSRFDWFLSPLASADQSPTNLPTTGPMPDAMKTFTPLVRAWLAKTPNITRLAFGAVGIQEVTDRISGYKLLNNYLQAVELDPEGSTEFSYAINRPRIVAMSNGETIKINRLSKWSALRFQTMILNMIAGQTPSADPVGNAFHAIRLELDINTDEARREPLQMATLPELFDDLTELGEEIVQRGDIK